MLNAVESSRPAAAIGLDARLELRHLRYFVTVAEHLHFGRAAQVLHMSQPPLSRQIRDLEECVGVPLLRRSTQVVTLTEAGALFLEEARRILHEITVSVHMAQRAAAGETGKLAVAFDPLFEAGLLSHLRDSFSVLSRDVRLTYHRIGSEEQAELIRGGSLDAGFLILPIADGDRLALEPLFRVPAVAIMSAAHPLAGRREVSVRELADYPAVEVRDGLSGPSYSHVNRIGTMCGAALRVEQVCPSLDHVPKHLRGGQAVSLQPAGVRECGCADGVRCVAIVEPEADFTFGLAYDRNRVSELLSRFLGLARRMNEWRGQQQQQQHQHQQHPAAAFGSSAAPPRLRAHRRSAG